MSNISDARKFWNSEFEANSFRDWADDEIREHGDISFDDWADEEFNEVIHNGANPLTFVEWVNQENREAAHQAESFGAESKCACGCSIGKSGCDEGCKCGCNHKKGGAAWAQAESFESDVEEHSCSECGEEGSEGVCGCYLDNMHGIYMVSIRANNCPFCKTKGFELGTPCNTCGANFRKTKDSEGKMRWKEDTQTMLEMADYGAESFEAEPETWAPGESLPPSVISLIKEYIESGQNPKGIASILPKLLKMVDVEKQNRGKLVLELAKEAKNYYVHHLFYVVVKKEGQVMPNVIHRTFNLEKAIDYAERLWSDGIYEDVEVDCPGAETVVWMNGNLEDAWLELNAESFEAEIGDTIICIKDDPNGYFKKGDRAKYLKFEDQIDRYYDLNDNYIGPLQYKVKLLHNKNEFVVTPEIVDRYWRVVNEAESFETDVDWEGKPYTGQINPDDQDLDEQKADRNKDGKLSSWERAIGNQVTRGIREGGYGAEDCLVCGAEGFEACEYHSEEFELHDWYDPMSDYGMMEYHPEIQEQKSQYLDDLEEQKDSYEREQRREIIKSKDIDDRIRMIDQAVANQEKGVKRHLKGRFQNPITVLATKGGLDRYDFIKIGIFALLIGAVGVKVASK